MKDKEHADFFPCRVNRNIGCFEIEVSEQFDVAQIR